MERKNKPTALPASPHLPQPTIDLANNILTARLPTGDSCTVNLYGATVTSWKTSNGKEQLFLSTAAKLDGSKPIRGGIPLVFPAFGPPPKDHTTGKLPQHGFARNNYWEFLGKSSSESTSKKGDDNIKLDFGLGPSMLDNDTRSKWGYDFGLVYSVTLGRGRLGCQMHIQNKGSDAFEFQCLMHTYLAINVSLARPCSSRTSVLYMLTQNQDITKTTISGLESSPYIDKTRNAQTFQESSPSLAITSETDRVYTPALTDSGTSVPITVNEGNNPAFIVTRDNLPNVTVWNGWEEKIKGMADFEPKDGWKRYVCVEPGVVLGWVKLEGGDAWEGMCGFESKL